MKPLSAVMTVERLQPLAMALDADASRLAKQVMASGSTSDLTVHRRR